jgi:acyl-CoA synthetase (AMP-forming)/AMP-acid ligase II
MTLIEMMERRAASEPGAQYFSLFGEVHPYGRVWAESLRHAAGLARAGVDAGDKVCLIYPTCAEFFFTFLGALRLGAVPVPLYPTLGVAAMAEIIRDAEAVAAVTIGWFRPTVEAAASQCAGLRAVLEPSDLERDHPAPPLPRVTPDDIAFIQYTSGSTGHPRGVVLSHANVMETVRSMAEAAGLTRDDRVVSWLPLYHDMGLIGCSFTPPLVGAPVWLLPPDLRNPRQWLETITQVRASFTVSPDFGYRNCVRNIHDAAGLDLSSLKSALSGAEPVRVSTIERFEAKFATANLIAPCYGLAEATLAVAIWPRRTPIRLDPSGRFVSVGRACRGVSVKIMPPPPMVGDELPPKTEGEIWVRSPGVMQGYYNDPGATREVLRPGGWLRTGDLGLLDDDGFLYVTGRLKDVIIVAGQNVVPADVEDAVDHVPGVRYAAAVGIESERTGTQRLHVVAEVREPDAPDESLSRLVRQIVQRVHEQVGHRPARVLLVRPGTIPKTSSGKIQRSRLGEMILAGDVRERTVHASGGHHA